MPHLQSIKKKVVVIVDNNLNSELEGLEHVLATEDEGRKYDVFSFQDPLEVMDCLKSSHGMVYDIAIVDLTFDESYRGIRIDGTDIVDLMKNKYPKRPVLCCSAYADNSHVNSEFRNCRHVPDAAFSKKKYSPGRMLDIVEGCLKKYEKKLSHIC